jgi:cystathionine beta-synthase
MGARVAESIIDLIGKTPMVRLGRMTKGLAPRVYAKLEFYNPGGSVKDRIGLAMLLEAERKGLVKPGYTVVEPTSGNTGMGLALAAVVKGYRVICTVPDKVSQDKIDLLTAVGAEVRITPSAVPSDHPESYVKVAERIVRETKNSYMPNQYVNAVNPEAHYATTGPEIWEQTGGAITVLVAGVGTGGTVTGTGRFLKERKPGLHVVGVDPEGSILASRCRGEKGSPKPYRVEGIGEDFVPKTLDMSVIDEMITVSDKDAFLTSRRLAKEEGIIAGGSSGTAVYGALQVAARLGADDLLVVILPDSGRSYTDKQFSDDWMAEHGYIKATGRQVSVDAVLRSKPPAVRAVIGLGPRDKLSKAIRLMTERDISQLPVIKGGIQVGSVFVSSMINSVAAKRRGLDLLVEDVMEAPLPSVEKGGVLLNPAALMRDRNAVVVVDGQLVVGIITTIDVINYLAKR